VKRWSLGIVVVAGAVLAAGCSSSSSSGSSSSTAASSGSVTGKITVLAAASLQEVFTTIGTNFQAAHPGTTVTFSFGGSSDLAQQIVNGSPADVFAAASTKTMGTVTTANATSATPQNFATNTMEIATPPSDPAGIEGLPDLAKPDVKVAVCAVAVPCGAAAQQLFQKNNLTVTPATEEPDVKSVLTKVELGEVDAGIVYVTDVKSAGSKVNGIEIAASDNVTTTYPIAPLKSSKNASTAAAFVAYVLSPAGQSVMSAAGFGAP